MRARADRREINDRIYFQNRCGLMNGAVGRARLYNRILQLQRGYCNSNEEEAVCARRITAVAFPESRSPLPLIVSLFFLARLLRLLTAYSRMRPPIVKERKEVCAFLRALFSSHSILILYSHNSQKLKCSNIYTVSRSFLNCQLSLAFIFTFLFPKYLYLFLFLVQFNV